MRLFSKKGGDRFEGGIAPLYDVLERRLGDKVRRYPGPRRRVRPPVTDGRVEAALEQMKTWFKGLRIAMAVRHPTPTFP